MAGIYLHIPFCKQKCSYCNFHFSTDLKLKSQMVNAICSELELRKSEILEPVETIYFGGGTPSLLDLNGINQIFESIFKNYSVISNPEVTLEANPDDLTLDKIKELKSTPINRFSIGIQSFFDEDLRLMNRAHNANEAIFSVKSAQDFGFENITIDLIYGSPSTTDEIWRKNLEIALELGVPHISSYALTVEPKTVLDHQIQNKKVPEIDEEKQARQFQILVDTLTANDFIHYEISNFGKEGFLSQHNSNYWKGKSYLGIGPSAHSYDGKNRSWNIPNNSVYLKEIAQNRLPNEVEVLNENDRFNELVMIRLRMKEGLNLEEIKLNFPQEFYDDFLSEIRTHLDNETVYLEDRNFRLTEKGKFLADGIASSLFRVD
ncbi:MAG: radical SAM family heme chaperone HemW [Flavobacteriaceae bacterium]|nr:radical SAM family heme chaperone HemW [Flavobacteriaceae bacterium]